MSDYNYPEDEFDVSEDEGPVPIGVHRADIPLWRSWLPLLAVIVVVPALAWGAVSLLRYTGGSDSSGDSAARASAQATQDQNVLASPTPDVRATPTPASGPADLTERVTVYNGTNINGLAGRTGDKLSNGGFTSVNVPQGVYDDVEPQSSTVYYSAAEYRATAEEVAKQLGIDKVVEDPQRTDISPIVVVLRADFVE